MKRLLLILLMLMLLVGCDTEQATSEPTPESEGAWTNISGYPGKGYYGLSRIVDYEAGVVCYVYGEALFCLPLDWTTLKKGDPE